MKSAVGEFMFISKKALSRRTVLRGMGATIALPFMESMAPAFSATVKTAANPQRRFGAVYIPLGERPGSWTPTMSSGGLELSPILKPLEAFKHQMVVITDLCVPLDGHAVTVGAWSTGSLPKQTIAEDVQAGTSIDQVVAKQIGQDTVFPSLELATEDFTGYIGACDGFYACAYSNTISWRNPTTPLPMEINPRVLFERMFGRPGTRSQRLARLRKDRSILDSVKVDLANLEGGLGARDRSRLADYLDNVREIEQRIQRAEKQATTELAVPDAPVGVPESFEDHVVLLFDLLALAYEADITRVFSFMMNRDISQRVYPDIGITEPHHAMSHHGRDAAKLANLVKLNTYHIELFKRFLEKLRSTPDGDGSVLDHSYILYGSSMSESDTHSRLDVPTLVVGGGAGLIKGNRLVNAPKETPLANFMLDIANKFGVETTSFGTLSTSRLEI
jgi:hypothetical protein